MGGRHGLTSVPSGEPHHGNGENVDSHEGTSHPADSERAVTGGAFSRPPAHSSLHVDPVQRKESVGSAAVVESTLAVAEAEDQLVMTRPAASFGTFDDGTAAQVDIVTGRLEAASEEAQLLVQHAWSERT